MKGISAIDCMSFQFTTGNRLFAGSVVPVKIALLVQPSTVGGSELMAILLAAASAVGWGASDFYGGGASRHDTSVFAIVALSELLGVVLLLPALAVRGVPPPVDPRLLLAAVAGVAVTAELGLIYRALSRGDAFVTAPVGALGAAAAVTIGLIGGDPIDLAIAAGLLCALLGGAISAWSSPTTGRTTVIHSAAIWLGAAAAVGTMLVCFHAAARVDPYWATVTEHISTAISAGFAALLGSGRSLRPHLPRRPQMPTVALVAAVGVGGDLAYAAASRQGALSIVSAISSLYPLATVALGRFVQGRRPTRIQILGIAVALLGAVLLGAAAR
jgi:drug/metabolite transporter (DMT)-like permease